jgi:ABC-type polysaccharide/polyol phosphate export permease
MAEYFREILKRKDLLLYLVKSGLKAEHRNSYLGYFWWLLDPLLSAVVYYFLIAIVLGHGGKYYGLYLIIGLIAWRWTSSVVSNSSRAILSYRSIINQVYLPKAIFPMARTVSQLVHFLFGLVAIVVFLVCYQVVPGWQIVYIPLIILVQLLMLAAVSLLMAYVCVFIRDIDNIMSHIIRIWFYATPIIWEGDRLPENYRWVTDINPMAVILQAYRDVFMYSSHPNLLSLALVGIISLLTCLGLLFFYSRNEHKIIKAL